MDLWLVLAIPFLIFLAPAFMKGIATILLKYRNRKEKKLLQIEIIDTRKELSKINQVDQFAKFARAQRKLRAATDQLNSLSRQDIESKVKYVLIGQVLVYLLAVIFALRLVQQVCELAFSYLFKS